MRIGVLLLAAICALAPAEARADEGEPDWVFEGGFESWDIPLDWLGVWPDALPSDFPWEEVAYGELRFYVHGNGFLGSTVPVLVTAACGGQVVGETWTFIDGLCYSAPACIGHQFDIFATFTVYNPTSSHDFEVEVELSGGDDGGDGGGCYGHPDCLENGMCNYTLSLYAHPTAIARASWSTIKARY